jgi:IS4 transposase
LSIKSRASRLEAKRPPEPLKPGLTFLWFGEKDDQALAEMQARAEAEDRTLMVIRIVEPAPREPRLAEH